MNDSTEHFLAFGIHADTGLPLTYEFPVSVNGQLINEAFAQHAAGAAYSNNDHFGVTAGFDLEKLDEVGWGLIFAVDVDPASYLEQLEPLLALRKEQAGARFRIFCGQEGPRPDESANNWLNRHGASLSILDPDLGVPFYLLLVGPPTHLSFEFQYSLDIVAGVGRLDFSTLEDYRHYANSVVKHERDDECRTRRTIELFATCHDFDAATQLFTEKVARPLSEGPNALGAKFGFVVNPSLGEQSTKARLAGLLSHPTQAPSLLFTGTHGMAFNADDPRQLDHQGALVCQDWPGYGTLTAEHWFSAEDVPEHANIHGMIHFFFACYGCGTPEHDNYTFTEQRKRIANGPTTARLAQKLLSLPQGAALASLGHVDRAWASSFLSKRGITQTQAFRDVIHRLMLGNRIGHATDQFNTQWGTLSTELFMLLNNLGYGKQPTRELMSLRIARDDMRNYVVLGDPAVRLRAELR
ncbi:C25 family cysteine peptidase [Pseudomonas extremaustralis]|uniref:C25 family cysteine peptidase n=1 Tax=Pseudomonas extremaustralis TaxID=359110 RepID=UPI002AA7D2C7|nr:C25 family cysteine peptidase [Pseudomonas extremaustralis]